jgi:anti-sigma regulatory factor (Ser/Thr protein kinase)
VSISSLRKNTIWWKSLKIRLLILYLLASLVLLAISLLGQFRLLNEVGHTFGGFIWGLDADGQVVVVSTLSGQPAFAGEPSSLGTSETIVRVNGQDPSAMPAIYQHARPGQFINYTLAENGQMRIVQYPVATFTFDMWLQNYGLSLIAGFCWLLVGGILLITAREWVGVVEGITLLPVAMLFLLYSHWGNVQIAYPMDAVLQLLWFPAFALLGAGFIHLSLTYRPEAIGVGREPSMKLDVWPYLPLIALEAFNIGLFFIRGSIPTRLEIVLDLGYGVIGGLVSLALGVTSLVRIGLYRSAAGSAIRRQLGDLLIMWIGGMGLGFCLGVLPLLFTGKPLLPLPIFFLLGAIYPLVLLYAVRSLRLIGQLQKSMKRTEEAMLQQQRTSEDLQRANTELQRATSLLLHADAHLRSLLSERIHDQPKQQALRIRSLLGHWQHKLKVELERDPALQSFAQPVIEALGKVRKISEELEDDLRGLQLLVEDAYQRRSLGLKLHLEKLVREDLPALHPESPLKIQADLWALDTLGHDLEQTPEGEKFAEAVSYTITQALLNIYNHAGATYATVRTVHTNGHLEVLIIDDGRGFDIASVSAGKTSMFKADLKAREAGGTLLTRSTPRPLAQHGTTIVLKLPFPESKQLATLEEENGEQEPRERYIGRNPV